MRPTRAFVVEIQAGHLATDHALPRALIDREISFDKGVPPVALGLRAIEDRLPHPACHIFLVCDPLKVVWIYTGPGSTEVVRFTAVVGKVAVLRKKHDSVRQRMDRPPLIPRPNPSGYSAIALVIQARRPEPAPRIWIDHELFHGPLDERGLLPAHGLLAGSRTAASRPRRAFRKLRPRIARPIFIPARPAPVRRPVGRLRGQAQRVLTLFDQRFESADALSHGSSPCVKRHRIGIAQNEMADKEVRRGRGQPRANRRERRPAGAGPEHRPVRIGRMK